MCAWYNPFMHTADSIPPERRDEYEALVRLLMEAALPGDDQAPHVAERVARASMEPGHLWRAMRLEHRAELRSLLSAHFPSLVAGNTRDMRWKKYFYKRLCGWPGFHG